MSDDIELPDGPLRFVSAAVADDLRAERDALRAAIEAHRARWQKSNGTNPNNVRPSDLELWAVLGEEGTER